TRFVLDLDRLDLVPGLHHVGQWDEGHCSQAAGDAGDGGVVVLTDVVVVGTDNAFLPVDGLGEVVEGARRAAGAVERDWLVREVGVDLVPAGHLGVPGPDLGELVDRQAGRPVVLRVHHDSQAVVRDAELVVLDPGLGAGVDLLLLDLARCHRDVGLAVAELLEATTGARRPDRDTNVGVLGHEQLSGRLGQRGDGGGAVHGDVTGKTATNRKSTRLNSSHVSISYA